MNNVQFIVWWNYMFYRVLGNFKWIVVDVGCFFKNSKKLMKLNSDIESIVLVWAFQIFNHKQSINSFVLQSKIFKE